MFRITRKCVREKQDVISENHIWNEDILNIDMEDKKMMQK